MKKLSRLFIAVLTALACFTGVNLHTYAEGQLNTYEKTFTYTRGDGKTFGATVTIKSSAETDWNLRFEKENRESIYRN